MCQALGIPQPAVHFSSPEPSMAGKQVLCRKIKQGQGREIDQGVPNGRGQESIFLKRGIEKGKGHVKF